MGLLDDVRDAYCACHCLSPAEHDAGCWVGLQPKIVAVIEAAEAVLRATDAMTWQGANLPHHVYAALADLEIALRDGDDDEAVALKGEEVTLYHRALSGEDLTAPASRLPARDWHGHPLGDSTQGEGDGA